MLQENSIIVHVNKPCSKCGSHYRRGFRVCNICGTENEPSMPSDLYKEKKVANPLISGGSHE